MVPPADEKKKETHTTEVPPIADAVHWAWGADPDCHNFETFPLVINTPFMDDDLYYETYPVVTEVPCMAAHDGDDSGPPLMVKSDTEDDDIYDSAVLTAITQCV